MSPSEQQTGASRAADAARQAGKSWLWKALLAVLLSQAGLVLILVAVVIIMMLGMVGFAIEDDEPDCDTAAGPTYVSSEASEEALADIPKDYLELYKQAGEEYGIDWAILAGVGSIETDHGRLDAPGVQSGVNEYGCCAGPMQFDVAHYNTWGEVGVDGNGDGKKDVHDPEDAIPSAAKYLVQGGAPEDYQSALMQYNQAQWYVDDVLAKADEYRAADAGSGGDTPGGSVPATLPSLSENLMPTLMDPAYAQDGSGGSEGGNSEGGGSEAQAVSPLPEDRMGDYSDDWGAERPGFAGSTHEGTDLFAPKGTSISSMVDGVVEENTENNENSYSEVGGYNVMIRATEDVGPVKKGDLLLYAHMQEPPSVEPGDEVTAGDEIGKVGATGYGPEVTRDEFDPHLHLGWYTEDEGRAESASGAMNPYPLVEWVENNDSEAAGSETEDVAPTAAPTPEECDEPSGTSSGSGEVKGTGTGKEVYQEALKYDGVQYVLGGLAACKPGEQMDCTCLTLTVFKEFGFNLPDSPQDQRSYGEPVEGEPKAGDLIIYEDPGDGTGGHAAIARGDGGVFHCASAALGCLESPDYRQSGATPVAEVRRLVDGSEGGGSGGGE